MWVAFPFSRGSSQPRDQTQVSWIAGRFFTSWATREAQEYWSGKPIPSPADLANLGIQLGSPALQVDSLPIKLSGKPYRKREEQMGSPETGKTLTGISRAEMHDLVWSLSVPFWLWPWRPAQDFLGLLVTSRIRAQGGAIPWNTALSGEHQQLTSPLQASVGCLSNGPFYGTFPFERAHEIWSHRRSRPRYKA